MHKFCMLSGLGVLTWLCHHACQPGDMTITASKLQKLGSLAASLSLLYNEPPVEDSTEAMLTGVILRV